MQRSSRPRRALAVCALFGIGLSATADGVLTTIPHDADWGDNNRGSQGAVTPLTPTSFLAAMEGPDGTTETNDDLVLLVTGIDGTPAFTTLATPYASNWGPWMTVMCATRCAKPGKGPDNRWSTADDSVIVLDRLGSDNVVFEITVGPIDGEDGHRPIALDAGTLVISTFGPDGDDSTADDTVALITRIGTANTVTHLPAPFIAKYGKSRPVALSPASFLVMTRGADDLDATEDDAAYLFTDVGITNARTTIPTAYSFRYGASTPVRLSATRAVVCSVGPDGSDSTSDDVLYVLDRLGTKDLVRQIPVPSIGRYGAGVPVMIDADTVLVTSLGPDESAPTADDALYLVQGVAAKKPKVTRFDVGFLGDDAGARAVRIGARSVAVNTAGPDAHFGTADDQVALIAKLGTRSAKLTYIPLGGLTEGIGGRAVALGSDSFLIGNGGPDGDLGDGNDDRVTLVSDAFGTPGFEHFATAGDRDGWHAGCLPRVLGGGRAAFMSSGADGYLGTGDDDVFQVISGLPLANRLEVRSMDLLFVPGAPSVPARLTVKGALGLAGVMPSAACDVTITVGNSAQTIPAASLRKRGSVYTYSDARARKGFLTKVVLSTRKGTFQVSGNGVGTGLDTTHEDYVAVSVTYGDVHVADKCAATRDAQGLHYRAQR